jgi:hypothetical protein
MLRTAMMIILVLSLASVSHAQDQFDRICGGGQQRACNDYSYRNSIDGKLGQTGSALREKEEQMKQVMEVIEEILDLSFWARDFDVAQGAWHAHVDKTSELKDRFLEETGMHDSFERRCTIEEYRLQMFDQRLSSLSGELGSFCQFLSLNQARLQSHSRAQAILGQVCGGGQQPRCNDGRYRDNIGNQLGQVGSAISEKEYQVNQVLDELGDVTGESFLDMKFDSAQREWRRYAEELIEAKENVLRRNTDDSPERRCMLNEYILQLYRQRLSTLSGELGSLCQTLRQAQAQRTQN